MSGDTSSLPAKDRRAEYLRWLGLVLLGAFVMFQVSKCTAPLSVDSISIEYPTGQSVLIVDRDGRARLVQVGQITGGVAEPNTEQAVRRGAIDIDWLYHNLMGKLVDTWDEDKRIDQRVGVVRIFFNDDTSGTFHIYDAEFAEEVFALARANLVDEVP
jgi:hypothetical protein